MKAARGRATVIAASFSILCLMLLGLPALSNAMAVTASLNPPQPVFPQNHQLCDQGPDIRALQQFLNAQGFTVASTGPGSPGSETAFFGLRTYRALVKFQAANGLSATGFTAASQAIPAHRFQLVEGDA